MWLSHHWPEHQDRCFVIGRRHVCRRCAVLYPLVVLAAAVAVTLDPPRTLALALMWTLPVPMTLEWVAEHRGAIRYSPARQAALSAIAAVGLGVALAAHLVQPFDPDALAPVATHATICAVSAVLAARRRASEASTALAGVASWELEHERRERERTQHLRLLLSEDLRRTAGRG